MLVNVITRYPARPPAVLEQALVESDNAFGTHSITVAKRYLLPITIQNAQAFSANRVAFTPEILQQTRVENTHAFGLSEIENLAPGIRHLFPTKVVNASQFGTAQVRLSNRYLVQVGFTNANQFGASNVHPALRILAQTKAINANQFGAPTVVAATAVSAIVSSDADTTFVDSDGTARSSIAGGAFVNLDG